MNCLYCHVEMKEPQTGLFRCLNCGAEFVTREYREEQNRILNLNRKEPAPQFKKQQIPDAFKWAVWERDNFTCQICGSRQFLTVDHIYPESRGGELTMENTRTLCKSCNSRKGAG